LTILALCLLGRAHADYHYVSHSGSDEYPYTSWATAADSLQPAINAASSGDTVFVGSGVWEDAPCTLRAGQALIGAGMDSTTLRCTAAGRLVTLVSRTAHAVRVEGFALASGAADPAGTGIYAYGDTGLAIEGNRFVNLRFGAIGAYVTGAITNNVFASNEEALNFGFDACSLLVKNNTVTGGTGSFVISGAGGQWFIKNNLFAHNHGVVGAAAYNPGETAYVANNLFFSNVAGGTYYQGNLYALNTVVENNTFVGPPGPDRPSAVIAAGLVDDPPSIFSNNIVRGFHVGFYFSYYGDVDVSYSDFWDVPYLDEPHGRANMLEGNLFAEPMFADSNIFHLQMYSPLIDAGDPSILDVDGSRSDIGVYGGPGGSSYDYIDIPPLMPDSISYQVWNDTVYLDWRDNRESDFLSYLLHKDAIPGFVPSQSNLIAEPESSFFVDGEVLSGQTFYYRIASVDSQGNRSEYSPEVAVLVTGVSEGAELPEVTLIEGNYPNPFNSETIINYYLADVGYQPAEVKLMVCDIGGRLIKTLIDNRQYPGSHRAAWDGRGEGGEEISSGIYFARLIVSGIELCRARKILLVR
jgi:hypothetical protein